MLLDLDTVIFVGFLAINLAVGLFYSRGVKNAKEYAVGTGFTTSALVATIVATHVDGGAFSIDLVESYRDGLYYILTASAFLFRFTFVSFVIIPRMSNFFDTLSVQDAIAKYYGRYAGIITGLLSIILSAGYVAIQLKLAGSIIQLFFPTASTFYSILLIWIIVTLYSAFGGVKAVTLTDIIQFITFGIIIPYIGIIIWGEVDEPLKIFDLVKTNPIFDLNEVLDINNPRCLSMLSLMLVCTIPAFDPAFFQRIIMQSGSFQAQKSFLIAGVILFFIYSLISYIAIIIFSVNPALDPDNLLNFIVEKYTYVGFKGIFAIGIMACIMSTADSYLNSASVMLGHDLIKSLGVKVSGSKQELVLLRVSTVLVSIFALGIAYGPGSLFHLYMKMLSLYMPVVSVPIYIAVFGFKTNEKAVIAGMIAGLISIILTSAYTNLESGEVLVGMIANFIAFFIAHYMSRKSTYTPTNSKLHYASEEVSMPFNMFHKFKNAFGALKLDFSLKQSWLYQLAGAITIATLSTSNHQALQELQRNEFVLFTFIYISTLTCALLLFIEPILPKVFRQSSALPYIRITLALYAIIFIPSMLAIVTNFGQLQLIVLLFNSLILSYIAGWHIAISAILLCTVINIQLCQNLFAAQISFQGFTAELKFQIVYFLLFAFTIFISLLRPKEAKYELSEEIADHLSHRLQDSEKQIKDLSTLKQTFLMNLQHETNTPITGVYSMSQALGDCYDKLTDEERKRAIATITSSSERLISYANNLIGVSKLTNTVDPLKLRKVNLSNLAQEALRKCQRLYIAKGTEDDRDFDLSIEPHLMSICDEYYIRKSFENLIINSIQYCKKGKISISLAQEEDKIKFMVKDSGIGVPSEELNTIFDPFVTSSKTTTPAGGRGMGLTMVKAVAEIHGGTVSASSDGTRAGSVFTFIFPVQDKIA